MRSHPLTRAEIAAELLRDCPPEALPDHRYVADAINSGHPIVHILQMPELDAWPETYLWLKSNLVD